MSLFARYLSQHLPRARAIRLCFRAQHAREFLHARIVAQRLRLRGSALVHNRFANVEMFVAERGDLGQVRDAYHLMRMLPGAVQGRGESP